MLAKHYLVSFCILQYKKTKKVFQSKTKAISCLNIIFLPNMFRIVFTALTEQLYNVYCKIFL